MAVVQIHSMYTTEEDKKIVSAFQLASGELGWAIDTLNCI